MRLILTVATITCMVFYSYPTFSQSLPPLLSAIKNNDTVSVVSLLGSGADISVADEDADNVLMYAALYSTSACMKKLLEKGADPNLTNKLGETAVLWCTHDLEKTSLLLSYKANLNLKTSTGNTAFLAACVGANQTGMMRLMLEHGADPLVKNHRNETSLILTSLFGDTVAARLLLNAGVDINAKGGDGQSALFYCIKGRNFTMMNWLLANGADANSHDDYKATALGYAVTLNDPGMVNALLGRTSNINEQDIDGSTTLMWACYNEHDNPAIIQSLLDGGADVRPQDKKGQTALDWALKKGNTSTVALLKKAGATTGSVKPAIKK
jgi:ankyrin repeat protein